MGDKRRRKGAKPQSQPLFYTDHNFPQDAAEWVRGSSRPKRKVDTAKDLGFENRPDEFHFEYAANKERVLLTLDQGFLDDKRYPIDRTEGVIVFTGEVSNEKALKSMIGDVMAMGHRAGRRYWRYTKVSISQNQMHMRFRASRGCLALIKFDRIKQEWVWSGNCPDCHERIEDAFDWEVRCADCGLVFALGDL